LLGYGIVFGTGGGLSFILLQQGANKLVRRRRGLLNGYLVGLYPLGAIIATPVFHACNEAFNWRITLAGLATVLVVSGVVAALLTRHSGTRLVATKASATMAKPKLGLTFVKLSATFFFAATAGLMVLSQAREIVAAYGGATALAVGATTSITRAIALARISGGWVVGRLAGPPRMWAAHAVALGRRALLALPSPPGTP